MVSDKEILEILIRVRDEASKKLHSVNKSIKNADGTVKGFNKNLDNFNKAQGKLDKVLKRNRVQFAGWALSIMFFGMALQRVFGQVWKSGTKTFQDVMHSVEGTTTQFDMLNGSMKYLGFSVGEALEPLAAILIPIVDEITDWVRANPEITRGIIAWGIALGTIFTVGGAGVLAINGFRDLKALISGANTNALTLADTIGRIAGTVIIVQAAFEVITGKQDLFEAIDSLLLGAGLLAGATTPWGAALITIGVALSLLPEDFKARVVSFLGGIVGVIITGLYAIIDTALLPLFSIINGLIRTYNFIKGESVPELNQYAMTKASAAKTVDLFKTAFGDKEATQRVVDNNYKPQIFVNVELDGQEIATNTSLRIIDNLNTTG